MSTYSVLEALTALLVGKRAVEVSTNYHGTKTIKVVDVPR